MKLGLLGGYGGRKLSVPLDGIRMSIERAV